MRVLVGALVLLACAGQTHTRLKDWRSDQALFTSAVAVTPTAPRPWLNLASAYIRQGQRAEGLRTTLMAARLAESRQDTRMLRVVDRHLQYFDVLDGLCERPDAPSRCALLWSE